ncbi:MAG: DJ-1/PfpI family protein [Candidatus Bathyarchaeia archaeon]
MVSAVLFLAAGFEEVEAVSVVDVLRRCDVRVVVAGLEAGVVEGAHGLRVVPDVLIDDVCVGDFDAVVCPGGNPGYVNLRRDSRVLRMVREAFDGGKLVAAICAAPAVLSDAGILNGKRCTIYPGMEAELVRGGGIPVSGLVVEDGNVVTSQGPATALLFAFKVAERLVDRGVVEAVREKMLMPLVLK